MASKKIRTIVAGFALAVGITLVYFGMQAFEKTQAELIEQKKQEAIKEFIDSTEVLNAIEEDNFISELEEYMNAE